MSGIVRRIFFVVALSVLVNRAAAQTVSNVFAVQVGQTIEITYDLDKAADISVYVSLDDGHDYQELHKVTGDVGKTVGPGHNTIVWDVLSEVKELVGNNIVFKVRADANAEAAWRRKQRREAAKTAPYSTFFTLNAAYDPSSLWSYGFKVGQVNRVGWYASVMSNFHFKGMYHPFVEETNYSLTDRKPAHISLQAGLVIRPIRPVSLLLGAGYGYQTFTYKTTEDVWYSYPKRTFHGVDIAFGFLFDIKGFALSGEVVTTNFKTTEARVGVGFSLLNKTSKEQKVKVVE